MRSTLLLLFILSVASAGTKFKERKAVNHQPPQIFQNEIQIPSNEYLHVVKRNIAAGPNDGIEIGTTDYDYGINSGFARRIASYNNGSQVHMTYLERDVTASGTDNRAASVYSFWNAATPSTVLKAYPIPKSTGASGFAGIDVIPAGSGAGIAVVTMRSGGKIHFGIDGGPGIGTFTMSLMPDVISNRKTGDPQVTVTPDGNTIWFTVRELVARSTDFGATWIGIDSLKKYFPNQSAGVTSSSSPLLIAPNGTLYLLSTFSGTGSIPPLGSSHPDSADCIGYFKSTNNGTNWTWTTIGRDGDPLVVEPGDTVYTLFENFSQFSGAVDKNGDLHVVSNGYCLKLLNDSTVSNRFYTLYYKEGSAGWKIISYPNLGKHPDYDSSYYKYSGNAIGHSYPTISASSNSNQLLAMWSQPVFTNGKLDTTGGIVQYSFLWSESFNNGNTWFSPIEYNNTTGALFINASQWSYLNGSYLEVPSLYLADTVRGCGVFGDHDPVQVPWMFRLFTRVITDDVDEKIQFAKKFFLSQNHPNPFNPSTTIRFDVPQDNNVTIAVYDMLGRHIATVVDEFKRAGKHSVTFDGSQLSSGIYIYTMRSGKYFSTRKMVLQK